MANFRTFLKFIFLIQKVLKKLRKILRTMNKHATRDNEVFLRWNSAGYVKMRRNLSKPRDRISSSWTS